MSINHLCAQNVPGLNNSFFNSQLNSLVVNNDITVGGNIISGATGATGSNFVTDGVTGHLVYTAVSGVTGMNRSTPLVLASDLKTLILAPVNSNFSPSTSGAYGSIGSTGSYTLGLTGANVFISDAGVTGLCTLYDMNLTSNGLQNNNTVSTFSFDLEVCLSGATGAVVTIAPYLNNSPVPVYSSFEATTGAQQCLSLKGLVDIPAAESLRIGGSSTVAQNYSISYWRITAVRC